MTSAAEVRPAAERFVESAPSWPYRARPPNCARAVRPVVIAVDGSPAAESAIRDGVRLAGDLDAPVVFVYVRRGPSAALGKPYFQRRLTAEMRAGDRAIGAGLAVARRAGVPAGGEQLHGPAGRRLAEFARLRRARFIVVGTRRRRLGRSVSRALIRRADRPVLVAHV
jgi:nucleotide-binding universal stress UspA family protein